MPDEIKLRTIKTPRALGCYVTLAKPRAMEEGKDPEYSIALLWKKGTDLKDMVKAIEEAAISKWGPNAARLLGTKLRTPLRDGDEKDGHEEYKGMVYVNARSKSRVTIIDTNLAPVDPMEVYSGCYFHASLRFYPYSKKGNSGVGCGLQNIMLVGRGKRIDGRLAADQDFKDFKADTEGMNSDDISDMV